MNRTFAAEIGVWHRIHFSLCTPHVSLALQWAALWLHALWVPWGLPKSLAKTDSEGLISEWCPKQYLWSLRFTEWASLKQRPSCACHFSCLGHGESSTHVLLCSWTTCFYPLKLFPPTFTDSLISIMAPFPCIERSKALNFAMQCNAMTWTWSLDSTKTER